MRAYFHLSRCAVCCPPVPTGFPDLVQPGRLRGLAKRNRSGSGAASLSSQYADQMRQLPEGVVRPLRDTGAPGRGRRVPADKVTKPSRLSTKAECILPLLTKTAAEFKS